MYEFFWNLAAFRLGSYTLKKKKKKMKFAFPGYERTGTVSKLC